MLKDNYREKLLQILEQKARGQAVAPAPAMRPPAKVINLMDALKRSVLETSKVRKKPAARAVGTERGKKRKKA